MKVQKINESSITQDDVTLYKAAISKLDGFVFNASDVNMDKRIITIRLGNVEDELTLVNPVIEKTSEQPLVYFEKDSIKNKINIFNTRFSEQIVNEIIKNNFVSTDFALIFSFGYFIS